MVIGLRCYVCSNCEKPSNLQVVENGASGYSCSKTTGMIGGKIQYVSRGYYRTEKCYEYNVVNDGTGYFQNCCTGDACNKSHVLSNSLGLLITLLIAVNILKLTIIE
ncbi:unnamed protein product [Adineta steineri]|uniref:Uncharacterized protein n=2 Tax=Adineta steineri TaxID=433720 RepID=A0A814NL64_9BILA|nr:unnamed protein product [Adineta steineri]CAF1097012.1 unnamed protein product [Adineta steineri]CAF3778011.1 unnamed protein product [Adineta steineri]CAF4410110.1 unnamed protein product [Adineta steineri]